MRISLQFREQLVRLGGEMLAAEFENFANLILSGWRSEHTDDDKHGVVNATSVSELGRTTPQGYWITVPFNANDYGGNGTMTWTLQAGDYETFQYMLIGKTMFVIGSWQTTSVGGAVNTALTVKIPGGFVAKNRTLFGSRAVDNGVSIASFNLVTAGATVIQIVRHDLANWTASANTTRANVGMFFEIQ